MILDLAAPRTRSWRLILISAASHLPLAFNAYLRRTICQTTTKSSRNLWRSALSGYAHPRAPLYNWII